MSAPPILARTNNWNSPNCSHIKKITINADQKRALTRDCSTKHRYIAGIPTKIGWQFGGLYHDADSTKEGAVLRRIAGGIAELLNQLSREFLKDEF